MSASGEKISASSFSSAVIDKIIEKKTVSEDELFKAYRLGRGEMKALLKRALRNSPKEKRPWISFDDERGIYTLVAVGETPPKDWKGYVPEEKKEEPKA